MFPKAPSFWWQVTIPWYGLGLYPFSWLWQFFSGMRRFLKEKKPLILPYPVYSIGNVVVGGAGKTPIILALAHYIKTQGKTPVIVTKGYKGSVHASTWVNCQRHGVRDVGDEAWMMAHHHITCVVPKAVDILDLIPECPKNTVFLWDDGHQTVHLQAKRWLVVDSGQLRGNNQVMPLGPLREPWAVAYKRAQGIFWMERRTPTKTNTYPDWCQKDGSKAVVTCRAKYYGLDASMGPVIGFCALGYPEKFLDTLHHLTPHVEKFYTFPDHHYYTYKDWMFLEKKAKSHQAILVTTRKDWVKLSKTWQDSVHVVEQTVTFDDLTFLHQTQL